MGVPAAAIRELAQLQVALDGSDVDPVVLLIDAPVPSWLGDGVDRVHRSGRPLEAHLAEDDRVGEERAGREIGMLVAVLGAGVHPDEIRGVAAERVRRVAEVLDRWDHALDPRSDPQLDTETGVIG